MAHSKIELRLILGFLGALLLTSMAGVLIASEAITPAQFNPINLSNDNPFIARYPNIANSGSHVYVAWTESSRGIFFRSSADNGTTWTPVLTSSAKKLSVNGGVANFPVVGANGSNVYVTWAQSLNKTLQIYFVASTNYGAIFSKPMILDNKSTVGAYTPAIATWGSNVYVSWSDAGGSFVRSSNNAGVNWSQVFELANNGKHEAEVAAWGSYAYFVSNGGFFGVSKNYGASWNVTSMGGGSEPWIAASGSNVYIVWETKGAASLVYGRFSHDNGATLGNKTLLSSNLTDVWEPQIAAYGNYLYLAFHQLSPTHNVWMRVSSNDSVNFSAPLSLSGTGRNSGWATHVAVSGSNVFTVWPDQLNRTNWDVFSSASSNNGANWTTAPGINVSHDPGFSAPNNDVATSSIAAFGTHAFVVWQDNSTGVYQTYFARS